MMREVRTQEGKVVFRLTRKSNDYVTILSISVVPAYTTEVNKEWCNKLATKELHKIIIDENLDVVSVSETAVVYR